MSEATITAEEVLRETARHLGVSWADVQTVDAELWRSYLGRSVAKLRSELRFRLPEYMLVEERYFGKGPWASTHAPYFQGDIVHHGGAYYQALITTSEEPSGDAVEWIALSGRWAREVNLVQPGQAAIGLVRRACRSNPLLNDRAPIVACREVGTKLYVFGVEHLSTVWLEFEGPEQPYHGEDYSTTLHDEAGARAYYNGRLYEALTTPTAAPGTVSGQWQELRLAVSWRDYLCLQTAAYAASSDQDAQAAILEGRARSALERLKKRQSPERTGRARFAHSLVGARSTGG